MIGYLIAFILIRKNTYRLSSKLTDYKVNFKIYFLPVITRQQHKAFTHPTMSDTLQYWT
jgi:hypothetical protein